MGVLVYAFDELSLHCITGEILEYNIFPRKFCKNVDSRKKEYCVIEFIREGNIMINMYTLF